MIDTAIIRSKHPLCCFRRDNAGENFSAAVQKKMTENGIRSSSSTLHESWQNTRAEVQIRVLCNIARTNMISSCLTGKFWARAIFYAADILNIQYRTNLKTMSHKKVFGCQQDVSASHFDWNAGYMFEQSNVKIENSMLVGNQLSTVDDLQWTIDLVMSYMSLAASDRRL
jgi:hypothetical protein